MRPFPLFIPLLTFFFYLSASIGVSSSEIADLQTKEDNGKIAEYVNAVLYRAFRFTIVTPTQVIRIKMLLMYFYICNICYCCHTMSHSGCKDRNACGRSKTERRWRLCWSCPYYASECHHVKRDEKRDVKRDHKRESGRLETIDFKIKLVFLFSGLIIKYVVIVSQFGSFNMQLACNDLVF